MRGEGGGTALSLLIFSSSLSPTPRVVVVDLSRLSLSPTVPRVHFALLCLLLRFGASFALTSALTPPPPVLQLRLRPNYTSLHCRLSNSVSASFLRFSLFFLWLRYSPCQAGGICVRSVISYVKPEIITKKVISTYKCTTNVNLISP